MKRYIRTALATALVLASQSAAALGLGQIELKSKLGEPLLAEIPIISSDPAELEQLHAGLASPETFARIGLRPPEGVVANLQFRSALNARGNPVIRVTSSEPIDQPLLTFLVEVDWGQGRLVREYSTLLDAPRTVSAPLQPPIDAPLVSSPNTIVRAPEVADASDEPDETVAAGTIPDGGADNAAAPLRPTANAGAPDASAPRGAATAAPANASAPGRYGKVRSGETLSQIARDLDSGARLEQTMIALLRANPDAFIGGNIHLLKQGAVLRVPTADEIRGIEVAQAMTQVREQTRAWRGSRAPVPQPVLAGVDDGATAPAANPAADALATMASGAATAGARLEIVPPGASDAMRAGSESGISAGGEGDMVRQQLQQTQESLAARDAELAELKSRIEELEKLQADQQSLLTMKDNELAAVQSRLGQAQDEAPGAASAGAWIGGGIGVLVLALLGGWWFRRRPQPAPGFRLPPTGSSSPLIAGFPPIGDAPVGDAVDDGARTESTASTAPLRASGVPEVVSAEELRADAVASRASARSRDVPAWHAAGAHHKLNPAAVATAVHEPADVMEVETAPPASAPVRDPADAFADADAAYSPGRERLELARAYVALGDHDSARQLLTELVVSGDLDARQQAARILGDLA